MKQLLSSSIAAPGFFGLNTQESSITLSSGFALKADNCIIDKYGRLGARKGYKYLTQTGGTDTTIRGIHDFIGSAGHVDYISWGSGSIYKGTSDLVPIPVTGLTITDNDWQAATLNDVTYLAQSDHPMVAIDSLLAGSIHDNNQYSFVVSAYGRLWAAGIASDKYTLHFSDLKDGSFTGGSSGILDLREVWTQGGDEIVTVAGFNGYVVIFCKKSVVILGDDNTSDLTINPVNLYVVEVLDNVGCVARDTVKTVGDDIFFLSNTGLRSLNRVIQEKSNPLTDLSKNVRDEITEAIKTEDLGHLNAIYSPLHAFYLLVFPATGLVYCFDTRGKLEDGSLRVTKWPNSSILSGCTLADGGMYLGLTNGIGEYSGYYDNSSSYFMSYFTNYFDFDQPTVTKILKTVGITLIGGSGQDFIIKVGSDYTDQPRSYNRSVKQSAVYEWGEAEWGPAPSLDGDPYEYYDNNGVLQQGILVAGDAEFTGGGSTDRIKVAVGGAGSVLQLGFEAYINGDQLSIQKFDVYVKQGRTN